MDRRILLLCAALAAIPAAAWAAGKPVTIESTTKTLKFDYSWPVEAAAIRPLDQRFRKDSAKALQQAQKDAAEDMKSAATDKRPFNQHFFSEVWTAAGSSPRLLSLEYALGTFTGGAHPNSTNGTMLWDKRAAREIKLDDLFLRKAAFANLTRTAYCKALDKERLKRRQGEKLDGMFSNCPKYSELAISPVDSKNDGRFNVIRFVASPYVAGPYVEGEYELELPVTAQLIAAIKPLYRASFEVQRQ